MADKHYSLGVIALATCYSVPLDDLPLYINGCSGRMSWFYRIAFGRAPSCEDCCDMHDLRYTLGDKAGTRKDADKELRLCAARAGKGVPGWLEDWRDKAQNSAGLFTRAKYRAGGLLFAWLPGARQKWRGIRAWGMYAAVRAFGRSHWAG